LRIDSVYSSIDFGLVRLKSIQDGYCTVLKLDDLYDVRSTSLSLYMQVTLCIDDGILIASVLVNEPLLTQFFNKKLHESTLMFLERLAAAKFF
jgi:hypothetical protein